MLRKTDKLTLLKFLLLGISLFSASLYLPKISSLLFLLIPFISIFTGYVSFPKRLFKDNRVVLSLTTLLLFTITNYSQAYYIDLYPDQTFRSIILPCLAINFMFWLGFFIDYKKIPFFPFNFMITNLFLFGGGLVFVFLSVFKYNEGAISPESILIWSRRVPNFWLPNPTEDINGPTLDMYSYLGLCFSGLIVTNFSVIGQAFSLRKKQYLAILVWLSLLILLLMSFYSAVALGARTPILVLVSSAFISVVFKNYFSADKTSNALVSTIVFGLIFVVILLFQDNLTSTILSSLLDANVGVRIQERGFESSRYEIWIAALRQGFDFPWGGRLMIIPGDESYIHNIWLDQLYDTGLLPMLLLLAFHLVQYRVVFEFIRLRLPSILHIFVICVVIAFSAAYFQAPVLQASYKYFSISCFFFGSILRMLVDIKYFIRMRQIGLIGN